MTKEQVQYRWYERLVQKIPKSGRRKVYSPPPKHISKDCHWDDCEYSYSDKKKLPSLLYVDAPLVVVYPKVFDSCYRKRFSYTTPTMACSVANSFDPLNFGPARNEWTHKRKSVEDWSQQKIFSRHYARPREDFLEALPFQDDDGYYVEDYKRTRISRAPIPPRRGDWFEERHYFVQTDPPYNDIHTTTGPIGTYQKHSYVDDVHLEEELAFPGSSPPTHTRYARDPGLPMGRTDYIPVSQAQLEEVSIPALLLTRALQQDDVVLNEAPSSHYETSKPIIDHVPVREHLVRGMLSTLETMLAAEDTFHSGNAAHTNITADPVYDRHADEPSQRTRVHSGGRRHPRENMEYKTFHTNPRPFQPKYDYEYVDPREIPLRQHIPEHTARRVNDQRPIPNLKAQLEKYNQWWTDVQGKTMIPEPTLESIPFLSPSNPFHTSVGSPSQDWKWAAYKFFCLAFGLNPKTIPQPDHSIRLTFATPPNASNKQANTNLKALRAQLKLEKVRWHEDKLRAQFGNEVARDERSKSVWGAIMELKKEVEDALETGWVREGE